MISIQRTKELIGDMDMSDEEAIRVRDVCAGLAEIILDSWYEKQKLEKQERENKI